LIQGVLPSTFDPVETDSVRSVGLGSSLRSRLSLLDAAVVEPYESTEYEGMIDFHWVAASFNEAKKLADALMDVATRPELSAMSRVDGVDSFSIKDVRRTKH
jgi:hypothetical protein